MGRRNKNTFSKALGHLKSRSIDEKLQMLSERPANSTTGYMTINPSTPNADFVSTERGQESALQEKIPDFTIGENPSDAAESYDTSGLFQEDGTILTAMPPGDTSYILGPMSAMWYSWANQTRIGYIRQSDRRMQNLGYITGKLSDWDGGSSGFNSYGQITLEQAQWFRTVQKQPGATNDPDTYNYRAYYPGPPSNPADSFGRYLSLLVGLGAGGALSGVGLAAVLGGTSGQQDSDSTFSALLDRLNKLGKNIGNLGKNIWDAMSNIEGTTWGKLGGSILRSVMDPITYAGDIIFKGLPSGIPGGYNPAFTGAGPKWLGGKKITDMLGGFLGKDVQYFTPDLDTAIKYAGEGGNVVAMPRPKTGVAGFKNWFGSTVSRGFDPTKGVEQIVKTSDSVAAKNLTKVINLSDEGAAETLKALANKGATTNKVLSKLGKAVPFLNAGLVAADVGTRIQKGDYAGALLGGLQIIPGPVGWIALGSQVAYDVSGSKKNIPWNKPVSEAVDDSSMSDNMGAALIEMGLPKDKKEFIKEMGFYLMLQDQIDSNLLSMILKSLQGEELSSEQKKWMDKNFQPMIKAVANRNNSDVKESYSKKVLSESRKSDIIKNLKNPVVIPEEQKKFKVKPKIRTLKTVVSKPVATPEEYKPPMKMWGRYEYNQNVRASQERKNEVMNLLGEGEAAMQYRLKNGTTRSEQEMKEFWGKHPELYDFYFNNMSHRMLRKEQVEGGDFVVFLLAENGKKVSMSQSKLNEKLAEVEDQKLLDEYNKLNPQSEPISYEKDPLFKKVSGKLKPVINYPKKPAVKGYPDKAPPKLVNGFHPDLGKRYKYDKLDPQSAEAMPPQGNPEIDANIEKFTDKNAKIRKIKNLIGKKS